MGTVGQKERLMMAAKIQIASGLNFNWIKGFKQKFEEAGFEVQVVKRLVFGKDVALYLPMWLDVDTFSFLHTYDVKNITFLRRYELFDGTLDHFDFSKVGRLVVLNDYIQAVVKSLYDVESVIIPNGVVLDDWTFKNRGHGKDIAWVGHVNHRKCLPLAMEILAILPDDYTIHVAGSVQNADAYHYANYVAYRSGRKIRWYDHVDDMDAWLEDKNYILSTSVSEGCPNAVIEAMAKGIKPVVHKWPGADYLFGDDTYYFPFDAASAMMADSEYNSNRYRAIVSRRFSDEPYDKVVKMAKEMIGG